MQFNYLQYSLSGAGGTLTVDLTAMGSPYYIEIVGVSNPIAINNPFTVNLSSTTPPDGTQVIITWTPIQTTLGSGSSVQFGSVNVSDPIYLNNRGFLWMCYNATLAIWEYRLLPDFYNQFTLNGSTLANASVAFTAIQNMAAGSVLMGNGLNRPTPTLLSGDVTMNYFGVVTIGDDAVTNDKLADMPVGTFKVGGLDTEPHDVLITGPVTINYLGQSSITNNSITPAMLSTTIGGVFVATITLSSAQILALNTTTQIIIPSPGLGKTILIMNASCNLTYFGSAYGTNTTLQLFTSTASQPQATCAILNSTSSGQTPFPLNGGTNELVQNAPVYVSVAGGNPTGGTSTVTITVFYVIF